MATSTSTSTGQDRVKEDILRQLAALGGQIAGEDSVIHEGNKFVLPERMSKAQGVKYLMDVIKAEDEETSFSRVYKYRPWDGARAFSSMVKSHFGTMIQRATETMFGKRPPQLITINTGPRGETEQVPWGQIELPFLPGATVELGSTFEDDGPLFVLSVTGPKKYRHAVAGLFTLLQEELDNHSMYRGHAIDAREQANFLDLNGVRRDAVVYSEEVLAQLEASVWSVIKYRDANRAAGLPFKRAVLLTGPYGTGKTLAATLTAQVAVEHGVTFIQCRPNQDNIALAMQTARLYQPAVVFFEDMDTIGSTSEESNRITELLDVFDGMTAKATDILVVLTTNHPERLYKGLLRPGRLDAVIQIGALDRSGVEKLARALVPANLLGRVDWDAVYAACEGYMPAFVKEAIDRAKRYAIARNAGKIDTLTTEDFVHAALGLRHQFDLMNGSSDTLDAPNMDRQVAKILTGVVRSNINERFLAEAQD